MSTASAPKQISAAQHNEQAKFIANSFDRASTACITSGILTPALALLYGLEWRLESLAFISIGAIFCMSMAFFLHLQGRKYLMEII
ncbi:hypothetical protein [Agrobacterium sp. 10MFCol1.1]|uniref:hypothetical protein n=1 Tax=Agrobacterium sp. 10MFCol1.1 TaxID=1150775 RepID=UPI00035E9F1F|nr:hypothetical protein [Agrobacterium sp. 10MFCol1.1]